MKQSYDVQKGKGHKQNQHYKWTMPSVAQLQAGEQSEQIIINRQRRSSHTPEEGVCSRDRLLVDSGMINGSKSVVLQAQPRAQREGNARRFLCEVEPRTPLVSTTFRPGCPSHFEFLVIEIDFTRISRTQNHHLRYYGFFHMHCYTVPFFCASPVFMLLSHARYASLDTRNTDIDTERDVPTTPTRRLTTPSR